MASTKLHIAMYPWFALGHLTPLMHLSNMLAKKGHKISFLVPRNTQHKIEQFNLHQHLISFVPIDVPNVDGLPLGAETTSDVSSELQPLIITAMDKTQAHIEHLLKGLNVDAVFFDFAHWIPSLCRRIGIKSVNYCVISPITIGYIFSPERRLNGNKGITESEILHPPKGFPLSSIKFHNHEARVLSGISNMKFGGDLPFTDRIYIGLIEADALSFNASRELEGPFSDYLETQFRKPVLLSGLMVPDPPNSTLDEKLSTWFDKFEPNSVIYCAFGSECNLTKAHFQELLLGFELTGMPFMAVLKPPVGITSIDEAIPDGLMERVKGRGLVYGGWVQQTLILSHPSVGCFVTHCGRSSITEGLVNKCQLVLLPNNGDQIISSKIMSEVYKVGVEVEKGEDDGVFTRDGVCEAVKRVMDEDGEIGKMVRTNHEKIREFLLNKDVASSYMDSFSDNLQKVLVRSPC